MGPVRWLRLTLRREIPQWMMAIRVVMIFGVWILFRYVLGFDLLAAIGPAVMVGVAISVVLKVVWAAANPVPETPDLLED